MIGPWSHEEEVETFRGDVDLSPALTVIRDHELVFYDRYLKDEPATAGTSAPPAELFVLGANEWRGESEWPLPGTAFTPWHLRAAAAQLEPRAAALATSRPTATSTTRTTRCRRSAASARC